MTSELFALLARQPIYNAEKAVVAYELLYRRTPGALDARSHSGENATLQVVASAMLDIGLDRLAGGLPLHVNFPRELLVGEAMLPLPPDHIVIEVLESVTADPAVLSGIAALRRRGHKIALDDFSPARSPPELLSLADVMKIDTLTESDADTRRALEIAREHKLDTVAEGVETVEQFDRLVALGFNAFQGNFLQHPQTFVAQRVPASRLGMLRLLAALETPDYSLDEVEQLVAQDVSISYRVLRCINSSFYHLPRSVQSIREAILLLGIGNLRRLCTVVAMMGFDDHPSSLLVGALIRARMCEQLGRLAGARDMGPFFITGLFSMLDVLLRQPMSRILSDLPLAKSISDALIGETGDLGAALRCTRAYEQGQWDQVSFAGLDVRTIRATYLEAVFWAEETRASMVSHRSLVA